MSLVNSELTPSSTLVDARKTVAIVVDARCTRSTCAYLLLLRPAKHGFVELATIDGLLLTKPDGPLAGPSRLR